MTYESAVECLNEVKIEFEKLIEQNNLLDQSRNNAKEDLKFTKDDLKSTNESATK
jgi:FtsZ-binding cell division protein ZapB